MTRCNLRPRQVGKENYIQPQLVGGRATSGESDQWSHQRHSRRWPRGSNRQCRCKGTVTAPPGFENQRAAALGACSKAVKQAQFTPSAQNGKPAAGGQCRRRLHSVLIALVALKPEPARLGRRPSLPTNSAQARCHAPRQTGSLSCSLRRNQAATDFSAGCSPRGHFLVQLTHAAAIGLGNRHQHLDSHVLALLWEMTQQLGNVTADGADVRIFQPIPARSRNS